LSDEEKKKVAKLSSRARPTGKRVSFVYNGEWNDLPGGWKPLMENHYDVMYSESYDWWTLAMAFYAENDLFAKLKTHEFSGVDELGVTVEGKNNRVVVSISCRLDADPDYFGREKRVIHEEEEGNPKRRGNSSGDLFLDLLAENRKYLQAGDCRLLYGTWETYGDEEDIDEENGVPPKPQEMDKLPKAVKNLLDMLADA
jgi:hypothetical protein